MKLLAAIAIGAVACGAQQPCADQILNNTGIGEKAYKFLDASDFSSCCAACANETKCAAWTFAPDARKGNCGLKPQDDGTRKTAKGKIAGIKPKAPTPPPTPAPVPPPVPAGTQQNIVFFLTDDQDIQLGSMQAMPSTLKYLRAGGMNLTNHFVNAPICCPSRATIISGNYAHNNKVAANNEGGCMQGDPDGGFVRSSFKKAIFDVDTSRPVTANSEDTPGDTLTKVMDVNSFSYNYGE